MKNDLYNSFEDNDLSIAEDLEVHCERGNRGIKAYLKHNCDIDKKFNISGNNSFLIDMYGMYNPFNKKTEITYFVNTIEGWNEKKYIPTEEENKVLSELIEQFVKKRYNNPRLSCQEYYVSAYSEFYVADEEMQLVFEKNGDEFQIRNENDDFILFKSKDAVMEKYVGCKPEYMYCSERECDAFEFKEHGEKIYFDGMICDVKVGYKNPNDTNCVFCNSELDEKYAGGIWDLASTICNEILGDIENDYQEQIYNEIRSFIEKEKYCPRCGAMNKEFEAYKNGSDEYAKMEDEELEM